MHPVADYEHGGNVYRMAQSLNVDPQTILDFSSNINPLGMPEPLKERFIASIDKLTCYPDPEYRALRENIAHYLDIPYSQIIPGNGASEIIALLLNSLRPKTLLLCAPTFSEYENAARLAGVDIQYHTLSKEDGFQLNLTKLAAHLDNVDCLFLCNPNNPTSALLSLAELTNLADLTKHKKIIFVIDESFIELTSEGNRNSMVPRLKSFDNLFIIRSFTKIFAIPGLRLGYGLGSPQWIEMMAQSRLPWSVNAIACLVGDYLWEAPDFLDKTSKWLVTEKNWLYEELQKISCLKPFPPQSNFILVQILSPQLSAATLQDKLATQGILIRNAANFHSLNEQFFRVAVKNRIHNERLVKILQQVMTGR
ncbi:MAG TPA: threonine-phosphate decarboxylase [Firmicutes bacterium]|nr:threonine-phosphate decarboxylase [Bacillota bacterium]